METVSNKQKRNKKINTKFFSKKNVILTGIFILFLFGVFMPEPISTLKFANNTDVIVANTLTILWLTYLILLIFWTGVMKGVQWEREGRI